jgi:RNA polymerase sigma-70 factor (sigma-B/F/G subfamily)
MNLSITLWERDDEDLLDVRGVIDFASAPYLRQVIFERFDRGRYRIVVDLTHVRLVDASALRVLLYLQRRAEQGGGTLRTPGAGGTALAALEIAGVAKQLDAYTEAGPAGRTGPGQAVDLGEIDGVPGTQWPPGVTTELTRLRTEPLRPAQHRALRERIVESCMPAAQRIARRYTRSSEPIADLEQVAYVGLIKAVDGFDPEKLLEFGPYATATVAGELKRHFRDKVWAVRVPRRLQEDWRAVNQARDELSVTLARSPTVRDIAGHLGLSEEAVTEAIELGANSRPLSLDLATSTAEGENTTLLDRLGGEDPQLSGVDYHESLQVLLARLPERSQKVIALRFHGGLAQHEIAEQVGLSQMQVSRILRQSLATLRRRLEND